MLYQCLHYGQELLTVCVPPCLCMRSAAALVGTLFGHCGTPPMFQCDRYMSTAGYPLEVFCQKPPLLVPRALGTQGVATSSFLPHFKGWVGGHTHDINLHCPSDECWQCGGQLISTSRVEVLYPLHKCQHTTRDD